MSKSCRKYPDAEVKVHHKGSSFTLPKTPDVSPELSKQLGKTASMGMPDELVGADFVRQFRWALSGNKLEEVWVKQAAADYKNKLIIVELYDIVVKDRCVCLDFLDYIDNNQENLILTNYDTFGNPLYCHEYSNVTLEEVCPQEFDYGSSEVQTWKFVLKYESVDFCRKIVAKTSIKS